MVYYCRRGENGALCLSLCVNTMNYRVFMINRKGDHKRSLTPAEALTSSSEVLSEDFGRFAEPSGR